MEKERIAACALNMIFGYEPRLGKALLEAVGSAAGIFEMDREGLRSLTGPQHRWLDQLTPAALEEAERELEKCAAAGARFIALSDPAYPALLRECEDPPLGLYFKGTDPPEEVFGERPAIAVVGTRDVDAYGRDWCERLVDALAHSRQKPLIVSGLALGVDACAHLTALAGGLPTVAVMATGIEKVYPFRHGLLASRIAAAPGSALLTDYPTGTEPVAIHFLRRNRIIAGLCHATLLVESKVKGGGMLTAELAHSYGRALYALPGRADDVRSQGCNLLLRKQMAEAVTDPDSFLLSLGLQAPRRKVRDVVADAEALYASDAGRQSLLAVLAWVRAHRESAADQIAAAVGTGYPEAAALAARLESDGFLRSDVLGRYTIRIN